MKTTTRACDVKPSSRLRARRAGSSAKSPACTASKRSARETRGATPGVAVRTHQSRSLVARIHRALIRLKLSRRHLPQSLLGQANDYALSQWPALGTYLEGGRIEIDNNLIENAVRSTAIGKKNLLFIGDAEAGQRGAILYTIIESCRRRGLDPHAYLRDVLTRLPSMTN